MEEMNNNITLTDEEGNEINCEMLDMIEYEGKTYAVLGMEGSEETGEVAIMEYVFGDDDSDSDDLISVEDEKVLDAVLDLFIARYEEEDGDAE
jgi:uncharacterized protein YrzB (UPF0473 family)